MDKQDSEASLNISVDGNWRLKSPVMLLTSQIRWFNFNVPTYISK